MTISPLHLRRTFGHLLVFVGVLVAVAISLGVSADRSEARAHAPTCSKGSRAVLVCLRANRCQRLRTVAMRTYCGRLKRCSALAGRTRRACDARASCQQLHGARQRTCLAGIVCLTAASPARCRQAVTRPVACPTPECQATAGQTAADMCRAFFPPTQSAYCASRAHVPGVPTFGKVRLGTYTLDGDSFDQELGVRHPLRSSYLRLGDGVRVGRPASVRLAIHAADGTTPLWHLSNETSDGGELSLRAIATGSADADLLELSRQVNESRQVVLFRIMAEMNGYWNPYSSFNQDGTSKGGAYTPAMYRAAWIRMTAILRGGPVADIDAALAQSGMPPLVTDATDLPSSGMVGTVWNPQAQGNPNIAQNQPADFYPGDEWVDWVANDLFSINYHAFWSGMDPMYDFRPNKPFMIGEWGPWGRDDPIFIHRMFDWVDAHPRTEALVYYEGSGTGAEPLSTFTLVNKPQSTAAYRLRASAPRYQP